MSAGLIGQLATPAAGNRVQPGATWAADNGCFGTGYPGDTGFLAWLDRQAQHRDRCLFAVAPDVVGDAAATLARSAPMLTRIRAHGYPAALAAQNGLETMTVPWDTFDALFLGGDTDWKLGPHAAALTTQARARGKWVHMGRVNSLARLRWARDTGCDSADGTYIAFGPDINLGRLTGWLRRLDREVPLW